MIVGPDDASNRRVLEAVENELRQNRLGLGLVLADGVTGLPVDVRLRSGFPETGGPDRDAGGHGPARSKE